MSKSNSTEITNLREWEDFFKKTDSSGVKHWKIGRSAWCIANFMMNECGEQRMKEILSFLGANVSLESCVPEYKVRFDTFNENTRNHDLAIWGRVGDRPLFVGVEAKVDEPFDARSIEQARISGKSPNSKMPQRVDSLTHRINFKGGFKPDVHGHLKYQLLYSVEGTAYEMKDVNNAICVFLVLVFDTFQKYGSFDKCKAKINHANYYEFIDACTSTQDGVEGDVRELEIFIDDGLCEKKKVYSVYASIDTLDWK